MKIVHIANANLRSRNILLTWSCGFRLRYVISVRSMPLRAEADWQVLGATPWKGNFK